MIIYEAIRDILVNQLYKIYKIKKLPKTSRQKIKDKMEPFFANRFSVFSPRVAMDEGDLVEEPGAKRGKVVGS